MASDPGGSVSARFSTAHLPVARRVPALQDLFERSIGMDVSAARGQPVDLQVNAVPGLRRARMLHPFSADAARPAVRLNDGDDTVCLMVKHGGHLALRQGRREGVPEDGDAVLLLYRQPSALQFRDATYLSLRVPLHALALVADIEAAAARRIPGRHPALQLLQRYVDSLPATLDDPQLAALAVTHVHDLMALAIGATGDGREKAQARGVRAARLRAIQADVARDPSLGVEAAARRQGVSARYVQLLFEAEGTTFTEYANARRLDAALAMLRSPRYAAWSIAGIALEAGFRDLSNFNRRFRRRFGATPSDLRRAG